MSVFRAGVVGLVIVVGLTVTEASAGWRCRIRRPPRCCPPPCGVPKSHGTVVEQVQILQNQVNDLQNRVQQLEAQQ